MIYSFKKIGYCIKVNCELTIVDIQNSYSMNLKYLVFKDLFEK